MKFKNLFLATLMLSSMSAFAAKGDMDSYNVSDEELAELDALYSEGNEAVNPELLNLKSDCKRETCPIYILVDKSDQRADIYVEGKHIKDGAADKDGVIFPLGRADANGRWKVTTGMKGHETPNFDRKLDSDARVFNRYSSSKYPGGDWQGFGNMPFAMFILRGFAIHGTTGSDTAGNLSKLGTKPLSHGCVRIHSLNAQQLNKLVRKYGVANTWIRVIP
ncbi:MAG: L,D-transpeptidase [Bdellovibrionota bacterium]